MPTGTQTAAMSTSWWSIKGPLSAIVGNQWNIKYPLVTRGFGDNVTLDQRMVGELTSQVLCICNSFSHILFSHEFLLKNRWFLIINLSLEFVLVMAMFQALEGIRFILIIYFWPIIHFSLSIGTNYSIFTPT